MIFEDCTGALWSIFHNDGWSSGDVRIHTKTLSAEEIAGLAGRSTMYKPL
ncbi:MAG: hypothetical protein GY809_15420 [Planctomycetes bacterium]|nr:hypothetical protein [Planctomycetota bacterium]